MARVKPDSIIQDWKLVRSVADLPPFGQRKTYWCRMKDGRIARLQWREDHWVTWASFWRDDVDPLRYVVAYAPYTYKSPTTPEEKREYDRKNRREAKERRDRERAEWIAAGSPRPKGIGRRK